MKYPASGALRASAVALSAFALLATPVTAQEAVKVAVTAFLSGPASGPFGVPAKNGAKLVIEAINEGGLPAPYNSVGLAGARIDADYVDEAGGSAKQVREYRNLVQKRGVDVVIGYISSGSCVALAPVAEELKTLTVFSICGTPRVFEEAPREYVFRTMGHAASDNIAAARYVREKFPELTNYTGINQNYAWGRDSFRDFDLTMKQLSNRVTASDKLQFPKIFAGQYGAGISALLIDPAPLVHTSFWGGDLEAMVFQATARGLFDQKKVIMTIGAATLDKLGRNMPDGIVMGARGPYGILVRDYDSVLNNWFIEAYQDKYGEPPVESAYQHAQSVLALKVAYDKAAASAGKFPSDEQVRAAFEGLEFESFSTMVKLAIGAGHQAVTSNGYGITKFNETTGRPGVVDVKFYPAKCVNPPDGVDSIDWIKSGMPGAVC